MPTAACPECEEKVFVDAEAEQGDIVTCEECGAELEVVGLDPIELDSYEDGDGTDDDGDDYDDDRY
jgi:alpha-aminoadipate/glutamate carrier protein LysW